MTRPADLAEPTQNLTLLDMSYSTCLEWFEDWIMADPPVLVDTYDVSRWMNDEMNEATKVFLEHACRSAKKKEDALMILKAIYYEYFLFQQTLALKQLVADPAAVLRLKQLPQSAQKSALWHNESLDMLTGHEFGAVCYGTAHGRSLVIQKKCAPPVIVPPDLVVADTQSQTVFTYSEDGKLSPFKWGWRFEPVVRDVYARCFAQGAVDDTLGRIRHPYLPRLAASPDGVIVDGPRAGRLVEIKSPITRELTGVIPDDYYCQMQLQAEVCDVSAVDYIEIRFTAVLLKPGAPLPSYVAAMGAKNPWMGKICVLAARPTVDEMGVEVFDPLTYTYAYSDLFPSTEAGLADACAWMPNIPEGCVCIEESIWYVHDLFTKTVCRNRRWWADVGYPAYLEFWRDVDTARKNGTFAEKALFLDTSSSSDTCSGSDEEPAMKHDEWAGVCSDSSAYCG
jgi:YqaJ-like viral recombinase domain